MEGPPIGETGEIEEGLIEGTTEGRQKGTTDGLLVEELSETGLLVGLLTEETVDHPLGGAEGSH
jgi:hypothetical protein